ncbi:hypothetical protein [Terricaulis silvestris]|nr:hypothetical protein [Terricaulis silvestris]
MGEPEALGRFRRFHEARVIDPCGRQGVGPTAAFVWAPETVAATAVLFAIFDRARIGDAPRLRKLHDYLMRPQPEGGRLIELILSDIASGGAPVMWLTVWRGPEDGEQTTFSTRLSAELDAPIVSPGHEWEPLFYGKLDLRPLLQNFAGANVVPLRAVN